MQENEDKQTMDAAFLTEVLDKNRDAIRSMSRIYVASSWRNTYQPAVVEILRDNGHEVYDFRKDGFSWSEISPSWREWTPEEYIYALRHECAERGFDRDMKALEQCDVCVMVMPCGPSASMEAGWAKGAGKPVYVFAPEIREPDLMVKMFDLVTTNLSHILLRLEELKGKLG